LLREALGKTDSELGFGATGLPARSSSAREEYAGQFIVEDDDAALDYADGRYRLTQVRLLKNNSNDVITRYLVRVSVDVYPFDSERSNEHYRRNPLTLEELNLQAWCEDEPMRWEVKLDRDSLKEVWLLFENEQARFPLYPGETRRISYTYSVGDNKWGRWFQRAVRLPTQRLGVRLSFPAALRPTVWGTETSLTLGQLPIPTPIGRDDQEDRAVFSWETSRPSLNTRYRFEWKFRASDHLPKDWPSTMATTDLTDLLRDIGIRQEEDPILRVAATPFDLPSEMDDALALQAQLRGYVDRLLEIYPFKKGVGLAAPQVGLSRAMAVVKPPGGDPFTLINPKVVWQSDEEDEQFEGCLSFFDVRGSVRRPLSIRVETTALDGRTRTTELDRGIARLALHEIDHLAGTLYTDHLRPGTDVIPLDEYRDRDKDWHYKP
jgi:peptide deformylase